jgi:cytochrome c nitrite reductase small subunit
MGASRRDGGRLAWWGPVGLSMLLGALAGIGGYTFRYAEGLSYFSTDPTACVNCHIMQSEYDGWQKSSHQVAAVCVDCHLPEPFMARYLAKAENGWRHGQKFTTQDFDEPIFVQAAGLRILQDNCVRCHGAIADSMVHGARPERRRDPDPRTQPCTRCHARVGHGERAGLGGPLRRAEYDQVPVAPGAEHDAARRER